jgi:chromosomal replication initiation ATPase DnaA
VIRQLTFALPPTEAFEAANFFQSGSNAKAYDQVMGPGWPRRQMLLVGPAGAGKSHLLHVWADQKNALVVAAKDLGRLNPANLPEAVAVEDAQDVAGIRDLEEMLFHLWNHQNASGYLLITARQAPRDWGLTLPDLLSRMQSTAIAHLDPPDDALLSAVLVKLFADRQVHVQPNLIAYLVSRMERSIVVAQQIVAALDARALVLGKPITRKMAADLLGTADQLDSKPSE